MIRLLVTAAAAVAAHAEAAWRRLEMAASQPNHKESRYYGRDRRRYSRHCPLCGGPLYPDRRAARDVRMPNGQIRRVPEEVLEWYRCGRCTRSQVGVPLAKLNGR